MAGMQEAVEDLKAASQDVNAGVRGVTDAIARLVAVLNGEPWATSVTSVLPQIDFDTWFESARTTIGSTAASGRLTWPPETESRVAIHLELLRAIAVGRPTTLLGLLHNFFSTQRERAYADFVRTLFVLFVRDLERSLNRRVSTGNATSNGDEASVEVHRRKVFVVHGRMRPRAGQCLSSPQSWPASAGMDRSHNSDRERGPLRR